jgi:GntR family transcriptional regulator/MocR family aminotransferase
LQSTVTDLLLELRPSPHRAGRRAALENALRGAIRDGRLREGARLPSTRALAADLGVARATVVEVYEQLTAEGYLRSRRGSGTVVGGSVPAAARALGETRDRPRPRFDFIPGEPDCASFPRREWLAALRRVLLTAPADLLGYGDPRGVGELRAALSDYLGRIRGVAADPRSVVVFDGVGAALGMLGEVLVAAGRGSVAVEDPGMPFHREILRRVGVRVVPIRVDDHGLSVDDLEATHVGAALVTPAHQYPLGVTMSPERRAALIAWARRNDALIIEDDYDGEFRYDRQPVGAVQGLAPDHVVYAGTASKALAPGVRVGWLVLPPHVRDAVTVARAWRGGASQLEQAALADMLGRGDLDRHVRGRRAAYRHRRDLLLARLADRVPLLEVPGVAAGMHVTVRLPDGVDDVAVARHGPSASLALFPLAPHWSVDGWSGLVLGFSRPTERDFPAAVDALTRFLADQLSSAAT